MTGGDAGSKAQWRPRRLRAGPLRDIADWVSHYRRHWEESFERLDEYLREVQGNEEEQQKERDHGHGTTSEVTARSQFASAEEIEGALATGMIAGAVETWDRLEALLAEG